MRKLSHEELLARQEQLMGQPRLPLIIILDNIRSLHNVGSIFRTCDGIGVEQIYLCGITGCPPNGQISKTALDAEMRVPWVYCPDITDAVTQVKNDGYKVVALEQTDVSRPYQEFTPQGPLALIVGNEIEGISESVIGLCDEALEIEMAGVKNSVNVAVACGIAAYHIRQGLLQNK